MGRAGGKRYMGFSRKEESKARVKDQNDREKGGD